MPFDPTPGCAVYLRSTHICYMCTIESYDLIKNWIETKVGGWVELHSVHGDGTLYCQVEDISELFAATPGYVSARAAWDADQRMA